MKQLLIYFTKKQIGYIGLMLGLGITANFFSILTPISYQYLIDSIIMTEQYSHLLQYSIFILTVFLAYIILDIISNHMTVTVMTRLNVFLSEKLYEKMMQSEEGDGENHSKGEIITRMMNDINTIVAILGEYVITAFLSMITYIIIMTIIFRINIILGIVCLISTPMFFIISQCYGKRIAKYSLNMKKQSEGYLDILDESIEARSTIKLYDCYDYQFNRYGKQLKSFLESSKKLMIQSVLSKKTFMGLGLGFPIITLLVGAYLISQGTITIGVLISVLSCLNYIIAPSTLLSNGLIAMKQFKVALNRINTFYGTQYEINTEEEKQANIADSWEILCEGVSVNFKDKEVFDNLSFAIKKNELISIVGANGTGKTTIIKLLSGLMLPSKGKIYLGGKLVKKRNLKEIRKMISLVLQKDFLFADTVEANLFLQGDQDELPQDIVHLLKGDLREKNITKNAANLSGGEIQRVCLARALCKEASIFILDEGTSQIDRLTVQQIYKQINQSKGEKTILIVDHQLAYVDLSDRILYIQDSKHIYLDTHQELLRLYPKYKDLFHQTQTLIS